jgi:hypothetical protein
VNAWLLRNRVIGCMVALAVLAIALPAGAELHEEALGRAVYTWLLLAMCLAPVTQLTSFRSRHVLIVIFMGSYFMHFGAVDVQCILIGEQSPAERSGFFTTGEIAVLVAGLFILVGNLIGMKFGSRTQHQGPPKEWPAMTILLAGSALWIAGTCAIVYFQVFTVPEKSNMAAAQGFAAMGPLLTFVVMLGNLVQPLGMLILAYGYARHRGALWTALILAVLATQVVVGFITDIKGIALIAGVTVIVVRTLVDNRPPAAWIAAGLAFILLAFPVFQASREVMGERGLNRLQALHEINDIVALSLSSRDKVETGNRNERSQTFLERGYLKDNVEQVMAHVGVDLPFLNGSSLSDLPYLFVPRLLAPDKVHVAIGQLFTHLIGKSDLDTYISVSHLSEWYWNFGWPGIAFGMSLTGLLLGFTGARSSLEQGVTLTRVLILVATVQSLCLGFEGEIPATYSVWLRSVGAILLLHLVFARRVERIPQREPTVTGDPALRLPSGAPLRFPNVLR